MLKTKAYAAQSETSPLAPWNLDRRDLTSFDVQIEILYCGVCHSDLHTARGEWYNSVYPVVPGHEIVGKVIAVGSDVIKYTTGDIVGVGCMVDSCSTCASCLDGLEQYCEEGSTGTYNSPERDGSGLAHHHQAPGRLPVGVSPPGMGKISRRYCRHAPVGPVGQALLPG